MRERMSRLGKKLTGAVLALVMVLTMLPVTVQQAEAASGVQAKINEVLAVYPNGSYFTVASSTSGCTSSNHDTVNGAWCMGCYLPNIPARGNLPSGAAVGWTADTCCGFANYVYYCIFGHSRSSKTTTTTSPVLGDLVYTGSHWFIYLSEDSTNYYVYDANGYNGGKNKVLYNNYYPKSAVKSLTVYHATDYIEPYTDIAAGTYYLRNKTAAYLNADGTTNKSNLSVTGLVTTSAQRFVLSGGTSNSIAASFDSTLRVNPYSDTPTNGTNVNLYSGAEIGSDMHWGFEAVSGGYIIHNISYSGLVLGLDGTNVRVETNSGASDQIWELIPATYTIYYNALGGSGTPASQTKKFSENLTLSSTVPTLNGFIFKGWATSANASTAQYQPGGTYTGNGNATLYAVWEAISEPSTATYYFNLQGCKDGVRGDSISGYGAVDIYMNGVLVADDVTDYYKQWPTGTKYEIKDIKATDGHAYRGVDYGSLSGTIGDASVSISLLFSTMYTVTYNANGGTGAPSSQTKYHGDNLTLSSARPTRDGYSFTGWATSASATTAQYQPGGSYTTDANATLYAVWENEPDPVTLTGITVAKAPTKTVYEIGETLDTTGLTLLAEYSDDSSQTVTEGYTLSGFDSSTAGTKTVTATYDGKSVSFNVTVKAAPVVVDPDAARIKAADAKGYIGREVKVTVSLQNNPGLTNLILFAGYDSSVLTLTAVEDGGILGKSVSTPNLNKNPYQLTWENDTAEGNFTADGTLVTLTFTVAENAPEGEYAVTLLCNAGDAYDFDLNDVAVATTDGKVTVKAVLLGDVDGNGVVNSKDRTIFSRYLAGWDGYAEQVILDACDVNGDGIVNGKDRTIFSRYLAGWDGYEEYFAG